MTTAKIRYIYEQAGDRLTIIGAGGVDGAGAALDKIQAGASAVEIVTAIRPSWGRVAAQINRDLLAFMVQHGTDIRHQVGVATRRGAKMPSLEHGCPMPHNMHRKRT